jgi:hypothetical protein
VCCEWCWLRAWCCSRRQSGYMALLALKKSIEMDSVLYAADTVNLPIEYDQQSN